MVREYAHGMVASRQTDRYARLCRRATALIRRHVPDAQYISIQLSCDLVAGLHADANNQGEITPLASGPTREAGYGCARRQAVPLLITVGGK